MAEIIPSEALAWQRMREAILRCQADPTDANRAEVKRWSRIFTIACGEVTEDDVEEAA